jgi:hypothetical protein
VLPRPGPDYLPVRATLTRLGRFWSTTLASGLAAIVEGQSLTAQVVAGD